MAELKCKTKESRGLKCGDMPYGMSDVRTCWGVSHGLSDNTSGLSNLARQTQLDLPAALTGVTKVPSVECSSCSHHVYSLKLAGYYEAERRCQLISDSSPSLTVAINAALRHLSGVVQCPASASHCVWHPQSQDAGPPDSAALHLCYRCTSAQDTASCILMPSPDSAVLCQELPKAAVDVHVS